MSSKRRVILTLIVVLSLIQAGAPPARALTEGSSNNFFGTFAGDGPGNTGVRNSFFGGHAGTSNTSGSDNSFFGHSAGLNNTIGLANSFFGKDAGYGNTSGNDNSFFGHDAGTFNTTGLSNSFFGKDSGKLNTTGSHNSFFGGGSGFSNTTGIDNSFFGSFAGAANTTASDNSFFGREAGASNTTGPRNAFFGRAAGFGNTTGIENTFLGSNSGVSNTTGSGNVFVGRGTGDNLDTSGFNTFIGYFANGVGGITNASAIGNLAQVSQSNSLVLGSIDGLNEAQSSVNVGIGTDTPSAPLHVVKTTPGGVAGSINQGALVVNRTDGSPANIRFSTTPRSYLFQNNPSNQVFSIINETAGNTPFSIFPDATSNNFVVRSGRWGLGVGAPAAGRAIDTNTGAFLSTAGVWTNASSSALKSNIEDLSTEDAVTVLRALQPKSFEYKKAPGDLHLGFLAEDVPELVATAGRNGLSPMDLVTVAIRVLQAKDAENAMQSTLISDLQEQIDTINKALQTK